MIRVVIDTNILVSTLLQPDGLPAAMLMLALSGEAEFCVSDAVFAEYNEVIRRPHLKRPQDVIEGTLRSIRRLGRWVKPGARSKNVQIPTTTFSLNAPKLGRRIISSLAISVTFRIDGKRPRLSAPAI
jgi:predicted nucleic acid-binding protein